MNITAGIWDLNTDLHNAMCESVLKSKQNVEYNHHV